MEITIYSYYKIDGSIDFGELHVDDCFIDVMRMCVCCVKKSVCVCVSVCVSIV